MPMSATTVRRGLYGMFAGGLLGFASAAIVMPVANAEPDTASCSASSVASTIGTVSTSTSSYLAAHPETNKKFTDIAKLPKAEAQESFKAYFAANPQVENDLKAIQQPVVELSTECGIQVTPTPVVEALQAL
jgi:heme-binding protein